MAVLKSPAEIALQLQSKMNALQAENKLLKKKIEKMENTHLNISDRIDNFIDLWYEENKDLVDIGEVTIGGRFKVDLIPDELEKRLYSKMLKITYAFISRGIQSELSSLSN